MLKDTGRLVVYDSYIDSDGIKQLRGSSIDFKSLEFRHMAVVIDLIDSLKMEKREDEEIRFGLGYARRHYDNGDYVEALQRIDWLSKKTPIFDSYIFYYKKICEHVLKITLTKEDLEYERRLEKYRALPKALRWTMTKPQSLIRCKWCGRYIQYIHPDVPTFGFDTSANSCNYCGRMYPTPSWLWDSPDGRAYSYYRMSFSDEEFYEEFEQDYAPQPLCQRRQN